MNLKSTSFIIVLYLLLVAISGCKGNLNEPSEFDADVYPEKPLNLEALVGDGIIVLNWSHPALGKVSSFNIYRKDGEGADSKKIGSTAALTYKDINLRNGVSYVYRISAVGKNGFEGSKSDSVTAVPAVFSVNINSGREFTNSKTVTLTMTAPTNTRFMLVSNDSLFTDSQWESFSSPRVWNLSDSDGEKTVYVRFRDPDNREVYRAVIDKIILDTTAFIRAVSEDTEGQIKSAGDTIHFSLDAGETMGTARVDISGGPSDIVLFDDGTNDDLAANDGVYEVTYRIPSGTNVFDTPIFGRFVDRVGNVANRLRTTTRITINSPPSPVTLLKPEPEGSSTSLRISWTRNFEQDFASYRLFRGFNGIIGLNSTLVTTIESQSTLSYVDDDLKENTNYLYRLFVFDSFGLASGSNQIEGTTLPNEAPSPVTLTQPTQTDSASFRLSWARSEESDFDSYRLYRSQNSPVDTTQAPVAIINDRLNTSYSDTGLLPGIDYFYRLLVFDQGGLAAGSNEVRGRLNN
ncbi:MAG: fibronectin type III domain-containing protein [bacterium]